MNKIFELIANISKGKPAKVSEEQLNRFLNNIKEAFLAWNNPDRKKHIFECANNFINKVTQ